jgi:trehalose/maltose hydrolase-like predicted phosphorylase
VSIDEIPSPEDTFAVVQREMDWYRVPFWESIFSLTNGRIGTRGSFEEPFHGTFSRPMTAMAGLYNTLPAELPEHPMLPDWLATRITLDGERFDLRLGRLRQFVRWLDLRRGLLVRRVVWQDRRGRSTHLSFYRFLSLADRSVGVSRICVEPLDWSGAVEVELLLDAKPLTTPSGRRKKHTHWRRPAMKASPAKVVTIRSRTRQTNRPLVVAGAFAGRGSEKALTANSTKRAGAVGVAYPYEGAAGHVACFDRFVVFETDEPGAKAPTTPARRAAAKARTEGFDALLESHIDVCNALRDRTDIEIDGPADDQRAVRFNLFQLAASGPQPGTLASIGPKGLSGTHYLGHIFWDTEVYMVPFYALTDPPAARTLLDYRYRTLGGARRKATETGFRGARFAWESADTGDEACPKEIIDPDTKLRTRIWCGEIQDHITADVPWAIDWYVRASGDVAYLWDKGAEILFETARFWAGRVSRTEHGQYDIRDVMGPDEYHIHVNNDAFTNYLAQWNLLAAADAYDHPDFPKDKRDALIERLNLKADEPKAWRDTAIRLVLPYEDDTGFIPQADGFTERPDINLDLLRMPRHAPMTAVIGPGLCIEYQVLKQAEVVLLQLLLEDRFDAQSRAVNFDYYEPRTAHDSSLSVGAHAWAAAKLGRAEPAYAYFQRAAYLDLDDLAGNTRGGLHTANMGGVWMALVLGFAGLRIDEDEPAIEPVLPPQWKRLRFKITHRGRRYRIECRPAGGTVERLA